MSEVGKNIMESVARMFPGQNQEDSAESCPHCGQAMPKASDSPSIDPAKAKINQDDAMRSGYQPAEWVKNVKSGLGLDK